MKDKAWLGAGAAAAAVAGVSGVAAWILRRQQILADAPAVAPGVDLSRYLGHWFEIARLPNPFQATCVSDVRAVYEKLPGARLRVTNICRMADGREQCVSGVARVADAPNNARLRVRFGLFTGDYWIHAVGPAYEYALVGEPRRRFLWILSRLPVMDDRRFTALLGQAAALGYEIRRVVRTPQGASAFEEAAGI